LAIIASITDTSEYETLSAADGLEMQQRSPTSTTDNAVLRDWVRALEETASISAHPQRLLADVIQEWAKKQGDAPALLSRGEDFTFRLLAERANRYARWALGQNLAKGDIVCLMMPNRPEYVAAWLGLTSIGVVVALINTQLRGPSLAHCVNIVTPKQAIVAAEFCASFAAATAEFAGQMKIWAHGEMAEAFERVDHVVEEFSAQPLNPMERRHVTISDRALLIYTSGTTGLPKAANVSHRRLLQWSFWFAGLMDTGPNDRMYDCLPMYHSVGGVVAIGALVAHGGSVLIRDKFSVQHFWDDVADGDCTLVQYIGELARYLVTAPEHSRERNHNLRGACGNGLSADVWTKFQKRFNIPRILEFYAASEGNFSLYNVEGKVGAIGRIPSFLAHRYSVALVGFDPMTERPARDQRGFCVRCATGEVGEAIGKISDGLAPSGGAFEGYSSAAESEQKVLRNVFAQGDAWYRTGDLMRTDAAGFFYFVDRVGDTFRWKSENVSTSEVAAVIGTFPGIKAVSVYGVHVPGTEGAAGMAAIILDGELNLRDFRAHLAQVLPSYARPLFLRITEAIATTATFKYVKSDFRREGFDPEMTNDPIYFDDPVQGFVRLDQPLYVQIAAGKVKR
jgi:fatty-acyl-CoA synthase